MSGVIAFLISHLFLVGSFILAIMLVAHIFRQHVHPGTSIAWLMSIVMIPYVAVPAYLLFGGRKLKKLARSKKAIYDKVKELNASGHLSASDDPARPVNLLRGYGLPPVRENNQIDLIENSEEAYKRLIALIDGAQDSIHIMTFIFSRDKVGETVVEHLCEKARQGVKVRLLVDALGSFYTRFGFLKKLKKAGGEVGVFMPMLPLQRRWSANLRNHRKIAVFDGDIVLTGGMNIAKEYMGPDFNEKRWIDSLTEVRGPLVNDLNQIFQRDWAFATEQKIDIPPCFSNECVNDGVPAQVIASGPDVPGEPLYDLLTAAIYKARRRVWIVTPYFIPDYAFVRALKFKVQTGIDVRLILPLRSNHKIADMARNRLLRDLLNVGVRVFLHPTKMVHAKHIIIDNDFSISGSANIDTRSLYLNYEVAVYSNSDRMVERTEAWMNNLIVDCAENILPPRTIYRQWSEDFCWLLSPIL